MKMFKILAVLGNLALGTTAMAQEQTITIGTGGQTGVYFVLGQSICRLVNQRSAEHGLKCNAPATEGSIANINAIISGDMDMGVTQSDWQFHAYNGTLEFDGNKFDKERAVFSVHGETFTVIARADAGIKTFADLKDKRVNIGNPGSGQYATMQVVMDALDWTKDDFAVASELKSVEQAAAFANNDVDAIIYIVGHPNGSIQQAVSKVDAVLVPGTGPEIDKLIANNPYYTATSVPGGMYNGSDAETLTFGVTATFVTSSDVDDEVVYEVTKAVFDNFDRFKRLHPAFESLKETQMISAGLSAPLHSGAQKYYKERGWIE